MARGFKLLAVDYYFCLREPSSAAAQTDSPTPGIFQISLVRIWNVEDDRCDRKYKHKMGFR
jgi:hypothetical protein